MIGVIEMADLLRLKASLGERGGELLPGLISGYLQEAQRLLSDARAGFVESHPEEARRAAGSLSSESATYGARRLAKIAAQLETHVSSPSAGAYLTQAEEEYQRVSIALRAALEVMGHAP